MMKKVMKTLLALAMAFVCGGAWAEKVAEWTTFTTDNLTQGDYVIAQGDCTIADGIVTIPSSGNALSITKTDGDFAKAYTVVMEVDSVPTVSSSYATLIDSVIGNNHVSLDSEANATLTQHWSHNNGTNYGTAVGAVPVSGRNVIAFAYNGASVGETTYINGAKVINGGAFASGTVVSKLVIGAYNGDTMTCHAAGMRIHRLAIYSTKLTDAEAKDAFKTTLSESQKLLYSMHLDGNGDLAAESQGTLTVTATGSSAATFVTSGQKFGSGAMKVNSNNGFKIEDTTNGLATFETGWTVSFWMTAGTTGNWADLCGFKIGDIVYRFEKTGATAYNLYNTAGQTSGTDNIRSLANAETLTYSDANEWMHVAIVADPDKKSINLFKNGVCMAKISPSTDDWQLWHNGPQALTCVYIGGQAATDSSRTNYGAGLLDEFAIYNYSVNATQLKALANKTAPATPATWCGLRSLAVSGTTDWTTGSWTEGSTATQWVDVSDATISNTGTSVLNVDSPVVVSAFNVTGSGNITIKNAQNLKFDSIGASGLSGLTLEYDCTASSYVADQQLKNFIKGANGSCKVIFKGAGSNGATIDYGSTYLNTTIGSHMVFDGGTHTLRIDSESQNLKFASNGSVANPSVLVTGSATLNFNNRNLCGWTSGASTTAGLIRVNDGSTIEFNKSTGSMYWAQQIYLEPGATMGFSNNAFNINGGATTSQASQIYVPASTSANGKVAKVIQRTANNNYIVVNNQTGSFPGCSFFVGENSVLEVDAQINGSNASTPFKKHGAGQVIFKRTVNANTSIDSGFVGVSSATFANGLTISNGASIVFPAGHAANTPYTICTGTLTPPTEAQNGVVAYVGTTPKVVNLTFDASAKTVSYAESSEHVVVDATESASEYDFANTALADGKKIFLFGTNAVTLKNINSADLAKIDRSKFSGELTFEYDCTSTSMTADDALKNYIKGASNNCTFVFIGSETNGATLDFDLNPNTTFASHIVFRGGVHGLKIGAGASRALATGNTFDSPFVRVTGNAELGLITQYLSGYSVAVQEDCIIRIDSGSTLKSKQENTRMWYTGRFYIEPGATIDLSGCAEMTSGIDRFGFCGGINENKCQIYVPATQGETAGVAKIINRPIALCNDGTRGAGIYVGENSRLEIEGVTSDNVNPAWTKFGEGTLVIKGAAIFRNCADTITVQAGALEFNTDQNITVSKIIAGAGKVVKAGSGVLTLNAANTYTGGTDIVAGTITAGNNSAFGTTGAIEVTSGATLDINGKYIANQIYLAGDGVDGNGAFVNGTNLGTDYAWKITLRADASWGGSGYTHFGSRAAVNLGGFTFTKKGSNNFPLNNTSGITNGKIVVEAGQFQNNNNANNLSTVDLEIKSGATLNLAGGTSLTVKSFKCEGTITGDSAKLVIAANGSLYESSASIPKLELLEGATVVAAANKKITIGTSLTATAVKVDASAKTEESDFTLFTMPSADDATALAAIVTLVNDRERVAYADGSDVCIKSVVVSEMTATELNAAGEMRIKGNATLNVDTDITGTPSIVNLSDSAVTLTLTAVTPKKYVSAADVKKLNLGSNVTLKYAWNTGRVINLNFGSKGRNDANEATSKMEGDTQYNTLAGVTMPGSAWNNYFAASATAAGVATGWNSSENSTYDVYGMSVAYQGRGGNWDIGKASSFAPFMRGYIDDGSGNPVSVSLNGVPFASYDLVIYYNGDNTGHKFGAPIIVKDGEETTYSYNDGGEVVTTSIADNYSWGQAGQEVASYDKNVIRIDNLSGNITIKSTGYINGSRRTTIAAIQIVQTSTDEQDAELGEPVVTIGEDEYKTLGAAIAAASTQIAGGATKVTISLIDDLTAMGEVVPDKIVIDCNGHTLSGAISLQSGAYILEGTGENKAAKIDGMATSFDITFNHKEDIGKSGSTDGMIDYAGVSGMHVRFDNAFKLVKPGENGPVELAQDEAVTKETGAHLMNHPYVENITGFYRNTDQLTFAVVGTMPKSMRTTFIHMGESRTANDGGYGLLIATGDVKDEVIVAWNKGTEIHELTRMSVPNAATTRHVYVITKADDRTADSSTFTVYLDGKKWKTIEQKPRFMIIGGLQVGSDFGGIIKDAYNSASEENKSKYFRQSVQADGGVINVIRAYDRIISATEIDQYSVESEYPYHSPNGSSTRTFAEGLSNWVEETEVWSNTSAAGAATTDTAPLAGASVTATLEGAATIAVNVPAEGASYEALDIAGTGSATFTSATDSGAIRVTGMVTIGRPITVKPGSLDLGTAPITLLEDGTLTFDYSEYDVSEIYTTTKVNLTGDIAQDDTKVNLVDNGTENHPYHTLSMAWDNGIKQYVLTITPNHEDGDGVAVVDANYTSFKLLDGTAATALFPNDPIVIKNGIYEGGQWTVNLNKDALVGHKVIVDYKPDNDPAISVKSDIKDGLNIEIADGAKMYMENGYSVWDATISGEGTLSLGTTFYLHKTLTISSNVLTRDSGNFCLESGSVLKVPANSVVKVTAYSSHAGYVKKTTADDVDTYTFVAGTQEIAPTGDDEPVVIEDVGTGIIVNPGAEVEVKLPENATQEQLTTIAGKISVKYTIPEMGTVKDLKADGLVTVAVNQTTGAVELTTTDSAKPAATAIAMAMPKEGEGEEAKDKVSFTITDPIPGLFYSIVSADDPAEFDKQDGEVEDSVGTQATNSDPHTTSIDMPTDAKVKYFRVRVKATK